MYYPLHCSEGRGCGGPHCAIWKVNQVCDGGQTLVCALFLRITSWHLRVVHQLCWRLKVHSWWTVSWISNWKCSQFLHEDCDKLILSLLPSGIQPRTIDNADSEAERSGNCVGFEDWPKVWWLEVAGELSSITYSDRLQTAALWISCLEVMCIYESVVLLCCLCLRVVGPE